MATDFSSPSFPIVTGLLERGLRQGSLFWLLQSGGWLAFGVVMFGWALAYWPAPVAVLNKWLLVGLGVLASLCFREIYRRIRQRQWPAHRVGIAVLVVSFSAAPVWYEAHIVLFRAACAAIVWSGDRSGMATGCARPVTLPWLVPTETWLFYGFVLVTWSLLYFVVDGLQELHRAQERAARADALATAARLKALQAQLEPHFLFNALNALSTLVTTGRTAAATAMIAELSDFLRSTLSTLDTPVVTLSTELQFVGQYLKIQEYRFADRLRTVFAIDRDVLQGLVPTLLLQPIVENAIRHGILPKVAGGCVWVSATRRGAMLSITVEDDGVGAQAGRLVPPGVGLANTRRRLTELYEGTAHLEFGPSPRGGIAVRIEIPFQAEAGAVDKPQPPTPHDNRCV